MIVHKNSFLHKYFSLKEKVRINISLILKWNIYLYNLYIYMKLDNYFYLENFDQSECEWDKLVESNCWVSDGNWCSNPKFPKSAKGKWFCANCSVCRDRGGTAKPKTTPKPTPKSEPEPTIPEPESTIPEPEPTIPEPATLEPSTLDSSSLEPSTPEPSTPEPEEDLAYANIMNEIKNTDPILLGGLGFLLVLLIFIIFYLLF